MPCALQVKFGPGQASITAIISLEGEVVELAVPVVITEAVEVWLGQLAAAMQATLQQLLVGVAGMAEPFTQAPSQVLGLYNAISFTERCDGSWECAGFAHARLQCA